MAKRDAITAEYVRSILHYDPDTGVFTWRERPRAHFKTQRSCSTWNARFAGKAAGSLNNGYLHIAIDGKQYKAHRLAWIYVTGKFPIAEIDHKDMNQTNNRWGNLREATKSENMRNTRRRVDNTSGRKGVSWHRFSGKWNAYIGLSGKRHSLGYFDTIDDASSAYEAAARELHGEFARVV